MGRPGSPHGAGLPAPAGNLSRAFSSGKRFYFKTKQQNLSSSNSGNPSGTQSVFLGSVLLVLLTNYKDCIHKNFFLPVEAI